MLAWDVAHVDNRIDVLHTCLLVVTTMQIKSVMSQLLKGILYLHSNWILHRDLVSPPTRARTSPVPFARPRFARAGVTLLDRLAGPRT